MVKATAEHFKVALAGHGSGDNHIFTTQERIYSAHQLSKLISHPATQSDLAWKQGVLNFLLASTLFNLKMPFESVTKAPLAFSKELQKQTADVFFKAMDLKAQNFEAMCEILCGTMEFACRLVPLFLVFTGFFFGISAEEDIHIVGLVGDTFIASNKTGKKLWF